MSCTIRRNGKIFYSKKIKKIQGNGRTAIRNTFRIKQFLKKVQLPFLEIKEKLRYVLRKIS